MKNFYIVLCMAFLMPLNGYAEVNDVRPSFSYQHTAFKISENNNDTSGLWITSYIDDGNYIKYILADVATPNAQSAHEVVKQLKHIPTISTFLNNSHNVPANNWTVTFGIQQSGSDCYMVLQAGAGNTYMAEKLLYPANQNSQIIWNGSFVSVLQTEKHVFNSIKNKYEKVYTYLTGKDADGVSLNFTQAASYTAGSKIGSGGFLNNKNIISSCNGGSQIIAPYNYRISEVKPYKFKIGNPGQTNELWLVVGINGTNYLLAKKYSGTIPGNPSQLPDGQKLYDTLNNLKDEDWNGGVYFSFIDSCGKVSIYAQDVTGKPLGEAVIPNVTSFGGITNQVVGFIGSNYSNSINVSCSETICFTTGNRARNEYVRIPSNVKDTTFIPGSLSSVVQTKLPNVPSNLWLSMIVNGTTYTIVGTPPTTGTPIGTATQMAAIASLNLTSGIYFNFKKVNNQVFLNVHGVGQAPSTAQQFLLKGVTNINGNVTFGGSNIQNAVSVSPYQTWGLTAGNSSIGPCYQFSNATSVANTMTSPIVCSYYDSVATLSSSTAAPTRSVSVTGGNFNNAGLWLNMTLNGTNYVLVWTLGGAIGSQYGTILDQNLNTALTNLTQTDWNNGIIFSFVEANGKVSLNVNKTNGASVGSAVLPSSITKISDIKVPVVFGGSNMPDPTPVNPSTQAFGLTTQNPLPANVTV